jgi:DtxR family Mn-dependent transcriptional regulator
MAPGAEPTENYLKQIYELSLDNSPVKTSQIAASMGVSPAAVTEMIKRLESQKMVDYRPYHGVKLTGRGRRRALDVLRRHRLWETFLFKVLGLPWAQVHDHACRLEHGTDDQLAEALDEHLGRPRFDPHGDPIPGPDGEVEEVDRLRLSALEPGTRATIAQCTNENPRLLAYLNSLELTPGVRIELLERAPFNGPLTLQVGSSQKIVGTEVARTLLVQVEE